MKEELFYGAKPILFERARELRKRMTHAEKILWGKVRNRKIEDKKIRRQHPISNYIVDFYCHEKKLVIELDGGIHEQLEQKLYDIDREKELTNLGLKVIRFRNSDVINNVASVLKEIKKHLT
ncbi:MAG: endonuclease domain-containing protein [Bacteroidota bacterium]|nr:endonuclease domain-containing protein [Bacteroidota bacterium]